MPRLISGTNTIPASKLISNIKFQIWTIPASKKIIVNIKLLDMILLQIQLNNKWRKDIILNKCCNNNQTAGQ